MKSTIKIAIPLLVLVGIIFGITLFSQYTQKPEDDTAKNIKAPTSTGAEPPLRFFTSGRSWDPPSLAPEHRNFPLLAPSRDPGKAEIPYSFSVQDRVFQGFYEPSKSVVRRTQFWFENRNPHPVTMQLKGVSCSACSGGRLAPIPPEVTKEYLMHTAIGTLPLGGFNGLNLGVVGPAARFEKLEWSEATYRENPNAVYKIPAAQTDGDKWAPQWGVLELTYTVGENPRVPLQATFATQVDGTQQVGGAEFAIFFSAAKALEVSRDAIDFGTFEPLSGDREASFLVYSSTRGPGSEFGDLKEPKCAVQTPTNLGDPGKFIEVSKIERLKTEELLDVEEDAHKQGRLTRVRAAYRVTLKLRPKVAEERIDIGLLERVLFITSEGAPAQSIRLTALVSGPVWLANKRTDIDLQSFKGRTGTEKLFPLVTEKTGIELAIVEDESKPAKTKKLITYELIKREDRGGQGYYDLKVTVVPGRQYGAIDRDSVVVIEIKGPTPQRIRIPVKGSGEQG